MITNTNATIAPNTSTPSLRIALETRGPGFSVMRGPAVSATRKQRAPSSNTSLSLGGFALDRLIS